MGSRQPCLRCPQQPCGRAGFAGRHMDGRDRNQRGDASGSILHLHIDPQAGQKPGHVPLASECTPEPERLFEEIAGSPELALP